MSVRDHDHRSRRAAIAAASVLVVACGWKSADPGQVSDSGMDESSESSAADEPEEPTPPERDADAEAGDGDGDGGPPDNSGFIQPPDGGGMTYECDLWAQDCPAGEKCNVWANDGGGAWNATKCVPIDPDADEAGEPCTVVDNGVSGLDSCVLGAMCWDVDPGTNEGVCVAFCVGPAANPTCADPSMMCNNGREFALCLPSCCPLLQDCHEGEACYPVNDTFWCVPDAGGEQGEFGDECEFLNVCDPGLFCANPDSVPGCHSAIGCCSQFCYLADPNASASCAGADGGQECVPWFEDGQAPPGEEDLGACVIPS
jgi:hypothetical protein